MRITVTSVLVDDQDKALRFYTDVLGFVKKNDLPAGEARWLTVVSPEDPNGVELLLEPSAHPAAGPFKEALVNDGIRPGRVRTPQGTRRDIHPASDADGPGHDGRARRHLRKPHPDRGHVASGSAVRQHGPGDARQSRGCKPARE